MQSLDLETLGSENSPRVVLAWLLDHGEVFFCEKAPFFLLDQVGKCSKKNVEKKGVAIQVDGSEIPANSPAEVGSLFPLFTRFLYIPGGCLGFLNHQQ